MKAPKYSIVTPMFNSYELMGRYFESFESQTYKDFELIIVDDCSTDDSYKKICDFAKKTELNITILRSNKNSGPGNARNIGMDAARGEWITFVDNDDWVENTLLQEVNCIIEDNNVSCVIFDYNLTDGKTKKIASSMYFGKQGIVSLEDCVKYVRNHSVGKVYDLKKCRLANIRYPEFRRCEDVAFVIRAIDACGSAYYLKRNLYNYFQRSNSLSNNSKLDHEDMVKAFNLLENSLGDKYKNELKEKSVADILYGSLLMMCKSGKTNEYIKRYIKDYENRYPEWYKCQILNYLGISKKVFLFLARYKNIFGMKFLALIHTKIIG